MSKAKETLERARLISERLVSGVDQKEICQELSIHRAQVYDHDYLSKLPEPILGIFLLGNVAMMPLIKSHKKHGDAILSALHELTSEKDALPAKASRKITLKEIEAKLTGAKPTTETQPQSVEIKTSDARCALKNIMALVMEASEFSQDSDCLTINAQDARTIQQKLTLLEQWMDDLNPSESGQQGDPTDQSVGSYVFENMVDSPSQAEPDAISDEDDEQFTIEYDPEYLEQLSEHYAVQASRH